MGPPLTILLLVFAVITGGFGRSSTSSQPADFDCPEEFGYYAHPTDCTQYYVCVFGGALLESCTGGLMYSHELQTCDWPRNVGCSPGSVSPQQQQIQHVGQQEQQLQRQQPVQQQRHQQIESRQRTSQRQHQQQAELAIQKADLYSEDEQLGPAAEEIETERQQRVYRGQPSTVGQVASDRDALTHTNAIPIQNSGSRDKLSVVSYGAQQQYNSIKLKQTERDEDSDHNFLTNMTKVRKKRNSPNNLTAKNDNVTANNNQSLKGLEVEKRRRKNMNSNQKDNSSDGSVSQRRRARDHHDQDASTDGNVEEENEDDDEEDGKEDDEEGEGTKEEEGSDTSKESGEEGSTAKGEKSSEEIRIDFPDPPDFKWESFEDFKVDDLDFDLDKFLADFKNEDFPDVDVSSEGNKTENMPDQISNNKSGAFILDKIQHELDKSRDKYFPNFSETRSTTPPTMRVSLSTAEIVNSLPANIRTVIGQKQQNLNKNNNYATSHMTTTQNGPNHSQETNSLRIATQLMPSPTQSLSSNRLNTMNQFLGISRLPNANRGTAKFTLNTTPVYITTPQVNFKVVYNIGTTENPKSIYGSSEQNPSYEVTLNDMFGVKATEKPMPKVSESKVVPREGVKLTTFGNTNHLRSTPKLSAQQVITSSPKNVYLPKNINNNFNGIFTTTPITPSARKPHLISTSRYFNDPFRPTTSYPTPKNKSLLTYSRSPYSTAKFTGVTNSGHSGIKMNQVRESFQETKKPTPTVPYKFSTNRTNVSNPLQKYNLHDDSSNKDVSSDYYNDYDEDYEDIENTTIPKPPSIPKALQNLDYDESDEYDSEYENDYSEESDDDDVEDDGENRRSKPRGCNYRRKQNGEGSDEEGSEEDEYDDEDEEEIIVSKNRGKEGGRRREKSVSGGVKVSVEPTQEGSEHVPKGCLLTWAPEGGTRVVCPRTPPVSPTSTSTLSPDPPTTDTSQQTRRTLTLPRGNVQPQQVYSDNRSSYNTTSRYLQQPQQQYDPTYYTVYDEEAQQYRDPGDYTQYTIQKQDTYRKKPSLDLVQQEVPRSSGYSKNKFTQADIYQSASPQEYDTYSIQTNDDIPYRQQLQTKTSNRSPELKEAERKLITLSSRFPPPSPPTDLTNEQTQTVGTGVSPQENVISITPRIRGRSTDRPTSNTITADLREATTDPKPKVTERPGVPAFVQEVNGLAEVDHNSEETPLGKVLRVLSGDSQSSDHSTDRNTAPANAQRTRDSNLSRNRNWENQVGQLAILLNGFISPQKDDEEPSSFTTEKQTSRDGRANDTRRPFAIRVPDESTEYRKQAYKEVNSRGQRVEAESQPGLFRNAGSPKAQVDHQNDYRRRETSHESAPSRFSGREESAERNQHQLHPDSSDRSRSRGSIRHHPDSEESGDTSYDYHFKETEAGLTGKVNESPKTEPQSSQLKNTGSPRTQVDQQSEYRSKETDQLLHSKVASDPRVFQSVNHNRQSHGTEESRTVHATNTQNRNKVPDISSRTEGATTRSHSRGSTKSEGGSRAPLLIRIPESFEQTQVRGRQENIQVRLAEPPSHTVKPTTVVDNDSKHSRPSPIRYPESLEYTDAVRRQGNHIRGEPTSRVTAPPSTMPPKLLTEPPSRSRQSETIIDTIKSIRVPYSFDFSDEKSGEVPRSQETTRAPAPVRKPIAIRVPDISPSSQGNPRAEPLISSSTEDSSSLEVTEEARRKIAAIKVPPSYDVNLYRSRQERPPTEQVSTGDNRGTNIRSTDAPTISHERASEEPARHRLRAEDIRRPLAIRIPDSIDLNEYKRRENTATRVVDAFTPRRQQEEEKKKEDENQTESREDFRSRVRLPPRTNIKFPLFHPQAEISDNAQKGREAVRLRWKDPVEENVGDQALDNGREERNRYKLPSRETLRNIPSDGENDNFQKGKETVRLRWKEPVEETVQEVKQLTVDPKEDLRNRYEVPTTRRPFTILTNGTPRPPKKFRNSTAFADLTLPLPPPTSDLNLRVRPLSYTTQSTPGLTRANSRHRGSLTYTVSPNEAEAPVRATIAPARGRPTLKPSTTVVSKAQEFIDVYRFPPIRPDNVYPTPQVDKTAAKCRKDVCLLPDCYCGGKDVPGEMTPEETPQIVLLTFDDSVNDLNKGLYADLFERGRVNPNGCPISATFYVSHEWTDYSQVQNLYAAGHEIASHSVSHSFGEQFSQKKWTREVAGQREILAAYGGVRMEDVRGMRAPFLAIGGNKMFKMLYDANFTYDSSMPVYENRPPSWPYTLDYKIFHDCMIPPCPTKSYPGVWEVPMVMWQDLNGGRCSMGDACSNPPESDGVYKMLIKNFERHFTTNRAPFGLFYHAAWFTQPHHKEGFIAFLDTINKMPEVWIVTNWQAIQWVRDPTPLARMNSFAPFSCNGPDKAKKCNNPKVCNLWHKSGVRYMRTCQPCPEIYPWTGKSGVRNSRVDNDIE